MSSDELSSPEHHCNPSHFGHDCNPSHFGHDAAVLTAEQRMPTVVSVSIVAAQSSFK